MGRVILTANQITRSQTRTHPENHAERKQILPSSADARTAPHRRQASIQAWQPSVPLHAPLNELQGKRKTHAATVGSEINFM